MDLSPNFIQFVRFLSVWMRPHENEHSTSFASWEEPGVFFFKGNSGVLPSFIAPMERFT